MLSLGWSEILVIAVVALIFVGPKDLPVMLRNVGRAFGTVRRMSNEFRREIDKLASIDEVKEITRSISSPINQTRADINREFNQIRNGKVEPTGKLAPKEGQDDVYGAIAERAGKPVTGGQKAQLGQELADRAENAQDLNAQDLMVPATAKAPAKAVARDKTGSAASAKKTTASKTKAAAGPKAGPKTATARAKSATARPSAKAADVAQSEPAASAAAKPVPKKAPAARKANGAVPAEPPVATPSAVNGVPAEDKRPPRPASTRPVPAPSRKVAETAGSGEKS